MADCVYRQWFLEVFLSPLSNVNDRIMSMRDSVSSEGPKTTGIQQRSSALSFTHRDFSSFSESSDDVMHCRLWDLRCLCNITLRNVVFKVFQNLFYVLFHRLESLCPSLPLRDSASLMALFHCMVRHSAVQCGSLLGGFPLGTVPGTWYFFSTTSAGVPSDPYRYQNVTCKLCWSLIGHYCVTELATRDPPLQPDPLDLNQHSERRIGRNFCLNKHTFLYQPKNFCFVVCWGSTDVPLVDSRGADPARAWWGDAESKSQIRVVGYLSPILVECSKTDAQLP